MNGNQHDYALQQWAESEKAMSARIAKLKQMLKDVCSAVLEHDALDGTIGDDQSLITHSHKDMIAKAKEALGKIDEV